MSGFEESVSAGSFGMNNSFWNSLSIEVGQFINEMNVIQGNWPILSGSNGVLVIINDSSAGCG